MIMPSAMPAIRQNRAGQRDCCGVSAGWCVVDGGCTVGPLPADDAQDPAAGSRAMPVDRVRVLVVRSRLLGKCLALSPANGSRLNAAKQRG